MDANDTNLPLNQGEQPNGGTLVRYDPIVDAVPGTSVRNHVDMIGSNSLDECRVSLSGMEPPSASVQSTEHTLSMVKEVQVEEHKDPVLDADHPRRGQWSHLYQLGGSPKNRGFLRDPLLRAKDKLIISGRENSQKDEANTWHLRHLKSTHINESARVCANLMDGKNINSESALLPQDARLKILSTSSFSQFFGKKTSKGKGVTYVHLGDKRQVDSVGNFQSNVLLSSGVGMPSRTPIQLPEHNSGAIGSDSTCSGGNLREWLKPGSSVKNKTEGLNIFCQITDLVNSAHSEGVVLQQLRPSYFVLMSLNKLKYIGSSSKVEKDFPLCKKRPLEDDIRSLCSSGLKQQKLIGDGKFQNPWSSTISLVGARATATHKDTHVGCSSGSDNTEYTVFTMSNCQGTGMPESSSSDLQLEERWYTCPEELDTNSKFSSNIYSLGVILFELLCSFASVEAHSAAMFDIHHRILPPFFLSESPKEAGFCLWLMHPDPSSRPTIREILFSDLFCQFQKLQLNNELTALGNDDKMGESDLLLDFLVPLKEMKQGHAMKLIEEINCVEADLKALEGKPLSTLPLGHMNGDCNLPSFIKSVVQSDRNEVRLFNDMCQLEKAYFSMRSQATETTAVGRADRDLLKNRDTSSQVQKQNENMYVNQNCASGLGSFFDGLCKYTRFSKFESRGTLRNGDLLNSANVICSLSFDRDEEYIAVAGASKRIKIFEFAALVNDTINIHYPVIEMGNKSKLSCVSWNSYIKNYLASTDYDGIVQVWDAGTGVGFSQHLEHQKRAWSVDFSRVDPTKFATGSDDCSVKLWSTNEKRSTCTIWGPANVCCVQFSPFSFHLLAFGSADHHIYGYDLRYTRIPWCSLAGHEKTVSYVKFVDPETLVSASTDNTLKLWDLSKTSLSAVSSDACHLTFTGHTNKKHFVGLSVRDGYIACGSENNEVFTYYKSLPMPITSYKFSAIDSLHQQDVKDDSGLFVSSVCWRSKSHMVLAANSSGSIRLLQLV